MSKNPKQLDLVEWVRRKISRLDEKGRELPDPTPMAPPVGWFKQPSMIENIRAMVRQELSRQAQAEGFETFEESDDFDIEDDPVDPRSGYEEVFEPPAAAAAAVQDPPRPAGASAVAGATPTTPTSDAASKAAETPGGGGSAAPPVNTGGTKNPG